MIFSLLYILKGFFKDKNEESRYGMKNCKVHFIAFVEVGKYFVKKYLVIVICAKF